MANFFKEYHAEVKAERERKNMQDEQNKPKEYTEGEVVYIDPMYDENRNGKRFFVVDLGNGLVMLAKTKKQAQNGEGWIYSQSAIIKSK